MRSRPANIRVAARRSTTPSRARSAHPGAHPDPDQVGVSPRPRASTPATAASTSYVLATLRALHVDPAAPARETPARAKRTRRVVDNSRRACWLAPTLDKAVPHQKIKRVGHGFRNLDNYRLRLLLHCGSTGTLSNQHESEAAYHASLRRALKPPALGGPDLTVVDLADGTECCEPVAAPAYKVHDQAGSTWQPRRAPL